MKPPSIKHILTHLPFNFIIEKINNLKNFSNFEMKMMIFWNLMTSLKLLSWVLLKLVVNPCDARKNY